MHAEIFTLFSGPLHAVYTQEQLSKKSDIVPIVTLSYLRKQDFIHTSTTLERITLIGVARYICLKRTCRPKLISTPSLLTR